MFWLIVLAQITVSSDDRQYHPPPAWQDLAPNDQGQFMVQDGKRWRWHSLKELGERD